MADRKQKYYRNAPGRYYVDCTCIDHDACRTVAPDFFRRDEETGAYYILRQPRDPEEDAQVQEALAGCPVEAIGDDGELPDALTWLDPMHPRNEDDIKERAKRVAREAEYRRRSGDRACPECIIRTDAKGLLTSFDNAAKGFFRCHADDAVGKLHYSFFHDPEEMKACANDPAFKARMIDPGFTEDDWTIVPGDPAAERFKARVTLVPLREGEDPKAITGFLALYRRLPAA